MEMARNDSSIGIAAARPVGTRRVDWRRRRNKDRTTGASSASESLEGDDRPGVLDARKGLHLFVDEMADIGPFFHIELDEKVEVSRRRVDLGGDLGVGELVRHLVRLAEMAFDLDEEGNHARLRAAPLGRAAGNRAKSAAIDKTAIHRNSTRAADLKFRPHSRELVSERQIEKRQ